MSPGEAGVGIASWTPLLKDLLDLDRAGALGGIRAVIAERLRMVREQDADSGWVAEAAAQMVAGNLVLAAAALAAEIDRTGTGP
jgi:hypothetical protein